MRHTPERSLDTSDHHRNVRIDILQDLGIHGNRIVRPLTCPSIRSIGVVTAQTLRCRIMVHHRVHRTGIDSEIQSRSAELAEIAKVVTPVRLRYHSHPVAMFLKPSGDHSRSE